MAPQTKTIAPFGKERTAAECRARAAWDREAAAEILASGKVGAVHLAEGHARTARAYDARAEELALTVTSASRTIAGPPKPHTVTVELRAPRKGEAGWYVDADETPEDALAKVIAGRDTIDVGAYGYGFTAWKDHADGPDSDGDRCITVKVELASEGT